VSGVDTAYFWEVLFQAYLPHSGKTFTGSFNTIMEFTYHFHVNYFGELVPTISMEGGYKVLSNTLQCDGCMKVEEPSIINDSDKNCNEDGSYPNETDVIGKGIPSVKGTSSGGRIKAEIISGQHTKDKDSDEDGERALNNYSLHGDRQFTWCNGDRMGSEFFVSNKHGSYLHYRGTLSWSEKSETPCDLSDLIVGETYVWRTTGALNANARNATYEFCGFTGGASSELYFQVNSEGECVPLESFDLADICRNKDTKPSYRNLENVNTQETYVTLQGSIYIEGIRSKELSPTDLNVLSSTLSHDFYEGMTGDFENEENIVEIQSVTPLSGAFVNPSRRRDSSSLHQVDFQVTVIAENFGVDGSNVLAANELGRILSNYLSHSMRAGLFTSKLTARARLEGTSSLVSVRTTKLVQTMSTVRQAIHAASLMTKFNDFVVLGGVIGGIIVGVLLAVLVVASRKKLKDNGPILQHEKKEITVHSKSFKKMNSILLSHRGEEGTAAY